MANTYFGRDSFILLDKVTSGDGAYGTRTADYFVGNPLIGTTIQRTIENVPRPHLSSGNANRRAHFIASDNVGGTFTIEANYSTLGLILKHALGEGSTSGGSAPFTHTYTIAGDLPDNGLTASILRGTGGSGEIVEGVRVNSLTFSANSAEVAQIEVDVIAETTDVVTTDGSENRADASTNASVIAAIPDHPVLHHHLGTFTFDGVTVAIRSMTVTINNSLGRRQFLGSKVTADPLRSDFMSVEVSMEIDVNDQLYGKYVAGVNGVDATVEFNNGLSAANERSLKFFFQNCRLTECTDPLNSAGLLAQSIGFVCESDGTNHGLKIEVKNNATNPELPGT